MTRGRSSRRWALLALAALAWAAQGSAAHAQGCATCGQGGCPGGVCNILHCPPWFHHCQERPPVICIKCGCPRPVCNPCALPNFGYFQTCWTPWPLPPDWSHCKVPPPAAFVHLNPQPGPGGPPVAPPAPTITPTQPPSGTNPPPVAPPPDSSETLPRPVPFAPGQGLGRVVN